MRPGNWAAQFIERIQVQLHRHQHLAQGILGGFAKRGAVAEVGYVGDVAAVLLGPEDVDMILWPIHHSSLRRLYFLSTARICFTW